MPAYPPQERLVRKEVALGTLRELEPPQDHIGIRLLAPWMDVPTDDVIFDYAQPETEGMVPARAEDAESELAQKDLIFGGQARASVIDWAVKDRYKPSDVSRYRENLLMQSRLGVNSVNELPLGMRSDIEQFRNLVARDDARRRRKIDNRVEWLITQAVQNNEIVYADGKIQFRVTYGRPSNQQNQAPPGGLWSSTDSDPIGDIVDVQEKMFDLYGIRINRAIASRRVLMSLLNSDKFAARSGLAIAGSSVASPTPIDPRYLIDGWGPSAAQAVVERQTGLTFIEHDAVYRTRALGGTTVVNNRFFNENTVIFLPDPASVDELDDTIGFGKTLTSPHPEGNWTPGFYEWEQERTDPWGLDRGTGVKAFPVFPHMEWTYTMTVLA